LYRHTQIGWGIMIALGLGLLFMYRASIDGPVDTFAYVILILAFIMFSKLTITVDEAYIKLVFGLIGVPSRKFKLIDVMACQTVKHWLIGISLGIHFGSKGSLYNVSGRYGVQLRLRNGRSVTIGTDEPEKLKAAIEARLTEIH
jgi:hypothetical protein